MSNLPAYNNAGTPTPLGCFFQNFMDWFTKCVTHPFHGTSLGYWLLDPNGQAYTLYLTTLVGVSIWLLYSNQQLKAVAALGFVYDWPEDDVSAERDVYSEQDEDDGTLLSSPGALPLAREETHIMRELAPPGHHPTNAYLEGSPFRVAKPLGSRTGYSAAPGYQIPSASKFKPSKAFSTRSLQRDDDSDLAKNATISNQTPQGQADGTPTKEREAEKRATGALGFGKKVQEEGKPVVAHWSNEVVVERGRAKERSSDVEAQAEQ